MPPEIAAALSAKDLPVWVFITIVVLYHLSTAKWAAKIPGVLGAVPRWFQRRNIRAAEIKSEYGLVSEQLYQQEISRIEKMVATLQRQMQISTARELKTQQILTEAVSYINEVQTILVKMGIAHPLPSRLREYMEGSIND